MATLLDPTARGRVILVGAGPGDPGLLTVRAVAALESADVVVHDGLIDPRVLDLAPATAQRISVAKQRARHTLPQEAINTLIIAHVKTGAIVVRLKGGDPFIFGRGGEEVEAVRAAGLPVEVIPGVSAALGCAAEAMLPLTHRDHSSAVSFVAGQCKGLTDQDWSGLAGKGRTLVIYMGVATASDIADKLMRDGVAPKCRSRCSSAARSTGTARSALCSPISGRWSSAKRSRPRRSSSSAKLSICPTPRISSVAGPELRSLLLETADRKRFAGG